MNSYFALGFGIGGVVLVSAMAALVRLVMRRASRGKSLDRAAVASSYLIGGILLWPIAALGYADGGQIQWLMGFAATIPMAVMGYSASRGAST